MKIRFDFVTNSSSSSFIALGVFDEELATMLKKLGEGKQLDSWISDGSSGFLSGQTLGGYCVRDDCITITTTLDNIDRFCDYRINRVDFEDSSMDGEDAFPEDSRKARTLKNLKSAFDLIDIDFSDSDRNAMHQALARAYNNESVIVKVYIDETDSFETKDFSDEKIFPWNIFLDANGTMIKYAERESDHGELIVPDGVRGIKKSALKSLKKTRKITINDEAEICQGLFEGISCLEEVDLSACLQDTLPKNLFKNCISLKKVLLPPRLYKIQNSAFEGCVKLNELQIPSTVSYIERDAFNGCDSLSAELKEQISEIIAASANFDKKRKRSGSVYSHARKSGILVCEIKFLWIPWVI